MSRAESECRDSAPDDDRVKFCLAQPQAVRKVGECLTPGQRTCNQRLAPFSAALRCGSFQVQGSIWLSSSSESVPGLCLPAATKSKRDYKVQEARTIALGELLC